jgi:hypothetical protein
MYSVCHHHFGFRYPQTLYGFGEHLPDEAYTLASAAVGLSLDPNSSGQDFCQRLALLVRRKNFQGNSAMDPRRDTGGRLTLTEAYYCSSSRQGLPASP